MRFIVDMNLPPAWCEVLRAAGHEARHWLDVGDPKAADTVIMQWARSHDAVVFTHDLDFSALLANSRTGGPSVLQVRAEDVMPGTLSPIVLSAVRQFEFALKDGAIVVVEPWRVRCRVLPLK